MTRMRVLMVSAEASPFAKTGGLGDVVGALPAALVERGEEVAVAVPRYRDASIDGARQVWRNLATWIGGRLFSFDVFATTGRGVTYFFLDCPELFDRPDFYGHADDVVRFAAFSEAALGVARHLFRPQILHLHDWQTAPAAIYLRHYFSLDPTLLGARVLFTLHNLGYQGEAGRDAVDRIGLQDLFHPGALEFHGRINLLKGGLIFSDRLNTVSRRYAEEIQTPEFGFGLDGVLRGRAAVLTGILNGADYEQWNPETDTHIAARYSVRDLSGKRESKLDLLTEFGLPQEADRPLVGIVSRFAQQKGFDLLVEAAPAIAAGNVSLVALGTGDKHYEDLFRSLAAAFPDKVGVRIAYDERVAHKIQAGADMFLMPSRYEPCGLGQLYSLRYGTVPIVRATGGLEDTITAGTGFKFLEYSGRALMSALGEALTAYADGKRWTAMIRRGMEKDFSWKRSAAEYARLYREMCDDS